MLAFDFTVTTSSMACRLDAAQLQPGHAIEEAVKVDEESVEGDEEMYHNTHHVTFKLVPLAFSIHGNYYGTTTDSLIH